jgi:hypothetical protein
MNNEENTHVEIERNSCDICHSDKHELGVMYHHRGSDVYFECKSCSEDSFENVARRDIDLWLSGNVAA